MKVVSSKAKYRENNSMSETCKYLCIGVLVNFPLSTLDEERCPGHVTRVYAEVDTSTKVRSSCHVYGVVDLVSRPELRNIDQATRHVIMQYSMMYRGQALPRVWCLKWYRGHVTRVVVCVG